MKGLESPQDALELFLTYDAARPAVQATGPLKSEAAIADLGRTLRAMLGNPKVRLALARDIHSPPALLHWLAQDERDEMALTLARNPVTPTAILVALARRRHVGPATAHNPSAPAILLAALSKHWDPDIRRATGRNPNTPAAILRQLARDPNLWVRHAVARNPRTPRETLRQLAKEDEACLNRALATNENAQSALTLVPV